MGFNNYNAYDELSTWEKEIIDQVEISGPLEFKGSTYGKIYDPYEQHDNLLRDSRWYSWKDKGYKLDLTEYLEIFEKFRHRYLDLVVDPIPKSELTNIKDWGISNRRYLSFDVAGGVIQPNSDRLILFRKDELSFCNKKDLFDKYRLDIYIKLKYGLSDQQIEKLNTWSSVIYPCASISIAD